MSKEKRKQQRWNAQHVWVADAHEEDADKILRLNNYGYNLVIGEPRNGSGVGVYSKGGDL